MFISVDLPAPFSPRSACTSPLRTSRETSSLATMPGNLFVMPRISRTSSSVTRPRSYPGTRRGRASSARPLRSCLARSVGLLDRRRNLQLAGDDLRPVAVHQLDVGRGHGRVDLADAHAAVLQVEHEIRAALELALLLLLRDGEDAVVDPLHAAREDALRELELVDVDADAPLAALVGSLERAETAAARDLEEHVRALRDLVRGNGLALVGRDEVLRVLDQDLRSRNSLLRAELVARDPDVDRRDLESADRADRVRAVLCRHLRGEDADETAGLVRGIRETLDVVEEDLALLVREGRRVHGVVRDREMHVRELLRVCGLGARKQEACRDHELRTLANRRVEVRRVVARRVRLGADSGDPELRLRPVQTRQLVLVEPVIGELADVADERDRRACRRPRVA